MSLGPLESFYQGPWYASQCAPPSTPGCCLSSSAPPTQAEGWQRHIAALLGLQPDAATLCDAAALQQFHGNPRDVVGTLQQASAASTSAALRMGMAAMTLGQAADAHAQVWPGPGHRCRSG